MRFILGSYNSSNHLNKQGDETPFRFFFSSFSSMARNEFSMYGEHFKQRGRRHGSAELFALYRFVCSGKKKPFLAS